MGRLFPATLAALAIALLSSNCPAQEKIVVCGTGDSQDLLRQIGMKFTAKYPDITVEVPDSIGSSGGIKAVAADECQIGRVARPLSEAEREQGLTYRVFAFSPVVFLADPAAKVEDLSRPQIVDIFSGKISDWGGAGGAAGPISVVNREAKDSSRGVLNEKIEGFKAVTSPVGVTAGKTPEAVDLISATKGVIGYLPAAMTKGLDRVTVKVEGVEPSAVNVVKGKYDLVTPFGLVWKGDLKGPAARFFDFLKSEEGKKIILDYGVIPADLL